VADNGVDVFVAAQPTADVFVLTLGPLLPDTPFDTRPRIADPASGDEVSKIGYSLRGGYFYLGVHRHDSNLWI